MVLSKQLDQMDLTDTNTTFNIKTAEFIRVHFFSSGAHGMLSRKDHILDYETSQ